MGKIEYISPQNVQNTPKSEEAFLAALDWKKESEEGSFFSVSSYDNSETDRKDIIKLILIGIFVFILFTAMIYGFWANFSNKAQLHITQKNGSELISQKGNTKASFQVGQSFGKEFRIYEIAINQREDPLNFFSATLVALPFSQAKEIFAIDGSEIDAKIKASRIPVIAADNNIRAQLENYAEYKSDYPFLTLYIQGDSLKRKEVYYKNEPTSFNSQDFDDQEYLLVKNLTEIDWQTGEKKPISVNE